MLAPEHLAHKLRILKLWFVPIKEVPTLATPVKDVGHYLVSTKVYEIGSLIPLAFAGYEDCCGAIVDFSFHLISLWLPYQSNP